MPTQVPIEVFMIGSTKVDKDEVTRWMKHVGADSFELPADEAVSNPAMLIALAGKRCYMSFEVGLNPNVNKIRKDYVEYFDNILASGHGSVLEHSVYNFAIEGVSRVFTAEMNRHRAGWAISEGSLRFIRFGESIPYWVPDSIAATEVVQKLNNKFEDGVSITVNDAESADEVNDFTDAGYDDLIQFLLDTGDLEDDDDQAVVDELVLEIKKMYSRHIFNRAFTHQEECYKMLENVWADELAPNSKFANKKQVTSMMRRIVGLGVATGGVWSGNIRALRHVFAMRASAHAEEEMIHVFSRLVKTMAEKEPLLFGDFTQDDNGYWRPKYLKV